MHSSTSSFSRPVVEGRWGRTWLAGVVLAAAALGLMELFWRSRGHVPSVVDDLGLWSLERERLEDAGGRAIALLGASRMQVGLSTVTLREVFPDRQVVSLAVDGLHPLAVLGDLAKADFGGVVLCAVTAPAFERSARDQQQPYVDYYHRNWRLDVKLNTLASRFVEEHVVVADPYLNPRDVLRRARGRHGLPAPRFIVMLGDRSRLADYHAREDLAEHRADRVRRHRHAVETRPAPAPDEWLRQALEVEPFVERIRSAGGRVVFVRFPSAGEYWELDERWYPRAEYWDRFAAVTSAEMIHFRDVPGMRDLDCPDGSHLDMRDAPRFTRALAAELVRRGVLKSTPSR